MRPLLCLAALAATLGGCAWLHTAPRPTTSQPAAQAPTTSVVTDGTPYLYVFNGLGKTIDEINLKTLQVTKGVLTTGLYPNQFVTQGAVTYLVNSGDADCYKLDLRAHAKLDTLPLRVGSNPMSLHLLEGDKGLVVSLYSRDLAWLDLKTKALEATVSVPTGAPGGGVAFSGSKAYVPAVAATYGGPPNYEATYTFSGIHVYDLTTRAFLKTVPLAPDALGSYYSPADISTDPLGRVVVTAPSGLAVIDPATDALVRTIDFGAPAHSVQYVSATRAYAAAGGGMVSFDPTTGEVRRGVSDAIASGGGNFKVFGSAAYVANFAQDAIRVIDLQTEQASGSDLLVGDGPQDLAFVTVAE